jgi:hypothetical protein
VALFAVALFAAVFVPLLFFADTIYLRPNVALSCPWRSPEAEGLAWDGDRPAQRPPEFSIRASQYDVIQTGGPLSDMYLAAAESLDRILD